MTADDFGFRIALDALRAGVPVGDAAFRVQHVDGVVRDALHQHAELLFAQAQRLIGRLAFADVARDLGEAEQAALVVDDGIDDHMRHEAGAVLAHAPALCFEFSFGFGPVQVQRGYAGGLIFQSMKAREVLADDFVGDIAIDALRARIPAYDDPVGI